MHSLQQNRVPIISSSLLQELGRMADSGGVVLVKTHCRAKNGDGREACLEGGNWVKLIERGATPIRFDMQKPHSAMDILEEILKERSRGEHLQRVFELMSPRFKPSRTGRRICEQIQVVIRREKEFKCQIPPAVARRSEPLSKALRDEFQSIDEAIGRIHRELAKQKTSWAAKFFNRLFG